MKKATTKALAILLATLMLLGVGAVSASAAPQKTKALYRMEAGSIKAAYDDYGPGIPEGTLEIIDPGAATGTVYVYEDGDSYLDRLDLSGLVFKASGSNLDEPQTVNYDDVSAEDYYDKPQEGKIIWEFGLGLDWDAQPDGWKLGENQAILYVYGYQYTEFVVETVIDGVEYGRFVEEYVFYGTAPFVLTGEEYTSNWWDVSSAIALVLGVPATVSIPEKDDSVIQWFKFTPEASGAYRFWSDGARYSQNLWTREGEYKYIPGMDPRAWLYDEDGNFLAYNDDGGGAHWYDFGIYRRLEAGKTYYLRTLAYGAGSFTVTVDPAEGKSLTAIKDKVTLKNDEYIAMTDLVQFTGWELWDLSVSCNGRALRHEGTYHDYYDDYDEYGWYVTGFTGYRGGSETLYITAPDGEQAVIKVTVKLTLWGFIRHYILAGWITGRPDNLRQYVAGGLLTLALPLLILSILLVVPLVLLWAGIRPWQLW